MDPYQRDDIQAIETVIARQFGSLNWTPETTGDWSAFAADFHPDARLYPAARPARSQSVDTFVARMKGLAGNELRSFRETVLGSDIRVFGHVATAAVACEMIENDVEVSRSVEMLLLIKTEGVWHIVSQAWDKAVDAQPIPSDLMTIKPR